MGMHLSLSVNKRDRITLNCNLICLKNFTLGLPKDNFTLLTKIRQKDCSYTAIFYSAALSLVPIIMDLLIACMGSYMSSGYVHDG